MLNLIPPHPNLMTTNDLLKPILATKPFRDVRSELQSHAALAGSPAGVGLRIRPEHFIHDALCRGLATEMAVYLADVGEGGGVVGEEAAVEDEVFCGDEGGEGEGGEGLGEHFEDAVVVSDILEWASTKGLV
jgi:hypothetical protein